MKQFFRSLAALLAALMLLPVCSGCVRDDAKGPVIAATTAPVYQFVTAVCQGTDLEVRQVVTGKIACLHDFSLSVDQMRTLAEADMVFCSGLGLEDFLQDALQGSEQVFECSDGIALLEDEEGTDPHVWMDPANAEIMTRNVCDALSELYPALAEQFAANTANYVAKLEALRAYGEEALRDLSCRELITFHDGFGYFAAAFDLEIAAALEEEEGAMATAQILEEVIGQVRDRSIPSVFVEANGSDSAASVIATETGVRVYTLSMIMDGADYLETMKQNIDTVKEALG